MTDETRFLIFYAHLALRMGLGFNLLRSSPHVHVHLIHYMMKTWLISNYGGPSRIVGDIINSLSNRRKPAPDNRKETFAFYSAITGAIQRLDRLSRITHINGAELESCLLSRSTLSSLIKLLPIAEYDLWEREMTVAGLDFRNPVGPDMFGSFKKVCII